MRRIIANIEFHSVLEGYKNIEERNKHFDELSDEEKRLEIAWDALQLVLEEIVYPAEGHYWNFYLDSLTRSTRTSKSFQKKLNDERVITSCTVCQRGLIMLSQIRLGNKVHPRDEGVSCGSVENIRGFSIESFYNMEDEYERSKFKHPYCFRSSEKMANICCNILVNGDFNVKDRNDYLSFEDVPYEVHSRQFVL